MKKFQSDRRHLRYDLTMFLLSLFFAVVGLAAPCGSALKAGALCSIQIKDVHPTQGAVGMVDVKEKRNLIRNQKHLKRFLKKEQNRLKIVIGPEGKYYLIDRHHLTLALDQEKIKKAYALIMDNFSGLSEEEFWKVMKEKGWARFKDENGKVMERLPSKISKLKNDPYRSLAWVVRESGAFEKTTIPFAEFLWADHFRKIFSLKDLKNDWDRCVKKAIEIAGTSQMKDLPGFITEAESSRTKKVKDCLELYSKMKIKRP